MGERIITPKFRAAFANVFEPNKESGNYEITMIFDKDADLKPLMDILKQTAKEKWGDNTKNVALPIHKGEEKDAEKYPDFQGKIYAKAKSKYAPGIVSQTKQPIFDASEFYSGCYARASISAYAWEYKGKKGVGLNLNNIQKLANGPRFGNSILAEEEFDAVEVDTSFDSGDNDDNEFTL